MTRQVDLYLDQINRRAEVLERLAVPKQVLINDVTLREASQVVSFGAEEKIEIALALDALGVDQIQVGIPGVSDVDRRVVQRLKQQGLRARLEVVSFIYTDEWKRDIDACLECQADSIDMFQPVSEDKLEAMGERFEDVLDKSLRAIDYAKSQGVPHIGYCPFPANRTGFDRLMHIIAEATAAGADMILLTDTYGTSSPTAMGAFVARVRAGTDARLGIHCHNDMGLALANSLAAIEAGASWVEASVNGLGDRTGNCSLDELVVALEGFYELDLAVEPQRLYELSKLVTRLSGIPLPFGKPLVGDNAFVHRHDDDARGALRVPSSTVPIEPAYVGNRRRILLGGEYTGSFTVQAKAAELGVSLGDAALPAATDAVRASLAGRKQAIADEEFLTIVRAFA